MSLSVSGTFTALFLSQAENIIHVMYINFSFLPLSPFFHRANGKLIHPEVKKENGAGNGDASTANWKDLKHHFSAFVNIKKVKADHMKYLTRKITCVVTWCCAHARALGRISWSLNVKKILLRTFGRQSVMQRFKALYRRENLLHRSWIKNTFYVDWKLNWKFVSTLCMTWREWSKEMSFYWNLI